MNSKTFTYILVGAWGILISVLPFLVVSELFFPFIGGKNLFFRAVVEIVLILWLCSVFNDSSLRPRLNWLIGIFAGFTLWVGISNAFGIDPLRSFWSNYERMEGYITILHLFALFLVSAQTLTKDIWYRLVAWSVLISGITWIQGMVEHIKNPAFRIDGSIGNATYFAAYALIHIFFSILLSFKYKEQRYIWGAFALANVITIFYTGTRGALLGFAGGAVVAAVLYIIFEWKHKKVRWLAVGGICFAILVTLILGFGKDSRFIGSSPVLSRFGQLAHYAITFDVKGLLQDVGRSRTAIWGIAWEGAKERPVLGWGQDNFMQVFSKHYNPRIFDQEQWFDRTHNVFFDWLIAAGFVGLIGYLGIFMAMLWYVWKRDVFTLHEKIWLTGLVVAYFVHTFFVFDNITTYVFIMLVLAMVHCVSTNRVDTHHNKHHEKKHHTHVENQPLLITGAVVVAIALAWMINVPVYATGANMIKGLVYSRGDGKNPPNDAFILESKKYFTEALSGAEFAKDEIREQLIDTSYRVRASAASTSTKQEYIDLITSEVEKWQIEQPDDARAHFFAAVYYGSLGNSGKAVESAERALELSPRKQTMMFLLADTYEKASDKAKALDLYKQAFELDMSFIEPRLRYVEALLISGKKNEAELLMKDVPAEKLLDMRYVKLLMSIDRYDVIVQIFENQYKNNPKDIQTRVSLAAAYVEVGRSNDAIALLETIKKDVPESEKQIDYFISEIKAGRNPVQK